MLSKLENGKVVLTLYKCGRCNSFKELMEHGVVGANREDLLYRVINDDDLQLPLEHFTVMCPQHKRQQEGSTFDNMTPEELELMRNTKMSDIWMTLEE